MGAFRSTLFILHLSPRLHAKMAETSYTLVSERVKPTGEPAKLHWLDLDASGGGSFGLLDHRRTSN